MRSQLAICRFLPDSNCAFNKDGGQNCTRILQSRQNSRRCDLSSELGSLNLYRTPRVSISLTLHPRFRDMRNSLISYYVIRAAHFAF